MSRYPLIIRNNVALFYRGFMIVWLGAVAIATFVALRDGPPEPGRWWPVITLIFWAVGISGLVWSFNQETSVLRIRSNRSIDIERGKAFRREELWTDRGRFWIEESEDSDGDPYFKLWMDAPGGQLLVREGHKRDKLEGLKQEMESLLHRSSLS